MKSKIIFLTMLSLMLLMGTTKNAGAQKYQKIKTVEYFQLRDAAIENTNEVEWKQIVKTLNSIVKS